MPDSEQALAATHQLADTVAFSYENQAIAITFAPK
jgi:hypothetical protein